jgi:protein-S-isoprenylcysteine O-methyltransferase Ste14
MSNHEPADTPGVRFPPPLIYASAVVAGVLLDRRWSLPIGAEALRSILGWLLLAGSLLLMGMSVGTFRRRRTSFLPFRPATTLVITGPYRYTRNPMYVAATLLTAAFGLWLNTWWPIILLVPTLMIVRHYVIAREESYMRRRFGSEYDAYTKQVRRWL